mmetsp:Transcript_10538/g.26795  ORF Transcript_10538/g.26795 Transcript_10538/m.26795 type:complete len:244 (-) Transcript_10538:127-858(-)
MTVGPSLRVNPSGKKMMMKTQMCRKFLAGHCSNQGCRFAHSGEELRQTPDLTKTTLCKAFAAGQCSNADSCTFAHGEEDLRVSELCYKAKLCWKWQNGKCSKGDACSYAHGVTDLRHRRRNGRTRTEEQKETPTLALRGGAGKISRLSSSSTCGTASKMELQAEVESCEGSSCDETKVSTESLTAPPGLALEDRAPTLRPLLDLLFEKLGIVTEASRSFAVTSTGSIRRAHCVPLVAVYHSRV